MRSWRKSGSFSIDNDGYGGESWQYLSTIVNPDVEISHAR